MRAEGDVNFDVPVAGRNGENLARLTGSDWTFKQSQSGELGDTTQRLHFHSHQEWHEKGMPSTAVMRHLSTKRQVKGDRCSPNILSIRHEAVHGKGNSYYFKTYTGKRLRGNRKGRGLRYREMGKTTPTSSPWLTSGLPTGILRFGDSIFGAEERQERGTDVAFRTLADWEAHGLHVCELTSIQAHLISFFPCPAAQHHRTLLLSSISALAYFLCSARPRAKRGFSKPRRTRRFCPTAPAIGSEKRDRKLWPR